MNIIEWTYGTNDISIISSQSTILNWSGSQEFINIGEVIQVATRSVISQVDSRSRIRKILDRSIIRSVDGR